jgi:mitochondrial protein MBA1
MYTAFAEGDVRLLGTICCDGLRESFRSRIASRPRGERWEWELVKYTKRARVLSHRAASLGIEGMGLRQAVVRIASRQKLTRYKANGTVVPGSGQEKETVEYLVIQKKLEKAAEQEWMVWGTTEETTLEMLEEEEMADMPGESR